MLFNRIVPFPHFLRLVPHLCIAGAVSTPTLLRLVEAQCLKSWNPKSGMLAFTRATLQ